MKNLLGVVLCGGESKRMGTDKGLIVFEGKTWAARLSDLLNEIALPWKISINNSQVETYSKFFSSEDLIVDSIDIKGPLKGILSIHLIKPDNDLLVLACDLADMSKETLLNLTAVYQANPNFDFYTYKEEEFIEPCCTIYTSGALKSIYSTFQRHELKGFSLHKQIESGNTKYLEVSDGKAFNNYNRLLKD